MWHNIVLTDNNVIDFFRRKAASSLAHLSTARPSMSRVESATPSPVTTPLSSTSSISKGRLVRFSNFVVGKHYRDMIKTGAFPYLFTFTNVCVGTGPPPYTHTHPLSL